MKNKIIYFLLIIICNLSFLFSPRSEPKTTPGSCPYEYIRVNRYMRIPFNCDEFTFVVSAVNPSFLMKPAFERQSRPLFILMGSLTGYSLYFISYPFHSTLNNLISHHFAGQFSPKELEKGILYGTFYMGYIFLNTLIIFFTLLLFEKIVLKISGPWKNGKWLLSGFLLLLISNNVTKTFFWTAHQQMFTLLTPLLCIYIGIFLSEKKIAAKKLLLLCVLFGLLFLTYGNFLLALPVIILSRFDLYRRRPKFTFKMISLMTIMIICFFFPTILWIEILRLKGTQFYSAEISFYHQFVWIPESLQISPYNFWKSFINNTFEFLKTFASLLIPLATLAITTLLTKRSITPGVALKKEKQNLILFTLCESIIFFWLLGYYSDRLTYTIGPILILIAALRVNQSCIPKNFRRILLFLFSAFHLYTTFFIAPHFSEKLFNR